MLVTVRKANVICDGEEKEEEKRQEFSDRKVIGRDDKGLFKFYYFLLFCLLNIKEFKENQFLFPNTCYN